MILLDLLFPYAYFSESVPMLLVQEEEGEGKNTCKIGMIWMVVRLGEYKNDGDQKSGPAQ